MSEPGSRSKVEIDEQAAKSLRVLGPPQLGPQQAVKDAERLQILVRSVSFQRAEKLWFDRMSQRFGVVALSAAKKLGFGVWKKRYPSSAALLEALDQSLRPVLEKELHGALPSVAASDQPDLFLATFAELPGEPLLHPEYNEAAFGFHLIHDDLRHVAHSYVMTLSHGFVRRVVAEKRTAGAEQVTQATGLSADQLFVFEANLCQYYVPTSTPAYFEGQPMRAFARELANRFRKLAFGGQ